MKTLTLSSLMDLNLKSSCCSHPDELTTFDTCMPLKLFGFSHLVVMWIANRSWECLFLLKRQPTGCSEVSINVLHTCHNVRLATWSSTIPKTELLRHTGIAQCIFKFCEPRWCIKVWLYLPELCEFLHLKDRAIRQVDGTSLPAGRFRIQRPSLSWLHDLMSPLRSVNCPAKQDLRLI